MVSCDVTGSILNLVRYIAPTIFHHDNFNLVALLLTELFVDRLLLDGFWKVMFLGKYRKLNLI